MATTDWKWIGQHFPPIEDKRFVLGKGRYISDIVLPGMGHLATVPSPHAHARITRIDTSAAEQAPGVIKVITGRDLAEWMNPIPQNMHLPNVIWYPLAVDKARFAGEWVAAVIAANRYRAEDAAELVQVGYEPLVPLVDPLEAMQPEAAILHDAHGSNIAFETEIDFGDVKTAFQPATHVLEAHYRWARHSGVPLEAFGSLAAWDDLNEMVEPGMVELVEGVFTAKLLPGVSLPSARAIGAMGGAHPWLHIVCLCRACARG